MSLETGALCEPLSCLLHGWDRLTAVSPVQPDSRVLITGAGIIGNLWAAIFHHHGARNVTVSEPAEGRRTITDGLGITLRVYKSYVTLHNFRNWIPRDRPQAPGRGDGGGGR